MPKKPLFWMHRVGRRGSHTAGRCFKKSEMINKLFTSYRLEIYIFEKPLQNGCGVRPRERFAPLFRKRKFLNIILTLLILALRRKPTRKNVLYLQRRHSLLQLWFCSHKDCLNWIQFNLNWIEFNLNWIQFNLNWIQLHLNWMERIFFLTR